MSHTVLTVPPQRLFTRPFLMLGVADLAYFTSGGLAIYALPIYVTGPLGGDDAAAGLAFGAFAVTALVLRPWAGRLSDSRGRRPLLVGGALICALATLLLPLATHLAAVVALRLVLGAAEAAFFVAAIAALADLAPPSRMGEALSYNSLGLYLGLALGPPLGELLVRVSGFPAAWLTAAGLALGAAAIAGSIGETRTAMVPDGVPRSLIHRPSVPVGLAFLTSMVAAGGFLAFGALRAGEVGLGVASLPLFVYGIVVVTGRIAFAKVQDRLPPLRLGAAGLGGIGAGLVVMAGWGTPTGLIAGSVLLGLGVTFTTPAFFAAVFAAAPPAERGAASGTLSAFLDLGLGLGPIALGLVAEAAGITWTFAIAAGIAGLGAAWSLLLGVRRAAARSAGTAQGPPPGR
ncbi:MFS transporter [Occultella glacieicola]|uniref:MFS transporter n=1 Tax=Occultella glacieicola TaxID=2518684 RepID=A0ABY2DZL6_9MICO|nr:MFS transporter [Occultella glacieicola]TDE89997.1 MFS transporter [Occultella glacieicola]